MASNPAIVDIEPGLEYVILRYRIQNIRSTGSGACVGCCQQRVWMCPSLMLYEHGEPYPVRTEVDFDWEWRGVTRMGTGTTCSTVPATGRTWGQIKGFYR